MGVYCPSKMRAGSYRLKKRRKWSTKRLIIEGVILVVIVALGFAVKPAYRMFREYRLDRNLVAAQEAAQREDWIQARDKAHSVLLVRQNDFAAYRVWIRALHQLGKPRTYMAAAPLFSDVRATREDRLEALQIMVAQAPQAVALSAYDSLPKGWRDQASFRAAIIPLLIQRGEIEVAERGLREVTRSTDEPAVRLELVRILCTRPNAGRLAEARRIFAELIAANATKESLAALQILGEVPNGLAPDQVLPDLSEWLQHQPQAKAIHHLLAMQPALAAQPAAAQIYQKACDRFMATDPGVLGNWLISNGRAEQAITILAEPAKTKSDAYSALLHALLETAHTDDLMAALEAPPPSADQVEMAIVQATAAIKRGDLIASESAWTRALNGAAFDTNCNRFIEIARIAERQGAKVAAENAWVAAIRLGWGPLPLYSDLLPVFVALATKGRSEDLLAISQTLLRFEPLNPDLLNNFYYFALIHAYLPPHQVATAMANLVEQLDKPVYQSTLMLAEMMDGRPSDALARLPKFRQSKDLAPMMKTALEGTARLLAGDKEAGTAMIKVIDWSRFMRQERVVFSDLVMKCKIDELPPVVKENTSVVIDPEQIPAWRKAVEKIKITDIPIPVKAPSNVVIDPDQIPTWRKAMERSEKNRAGEVLPALPPPRIMGKNLPNTIPEDSPE